MYIETKKLVKGAVERQGDKIENPDFIRRNKISQLQVLHYEPDYEACRTDLCTYSRKPSWIQTSSRLWEKKYKALAAKKTHEKALEKIKELRYEEASKLIFGEVLERQRTSEQAHKRLQGSSQ